MNAAKARAIIAQALEDEATEGPIPEDDKKAIAKATELVELAQEAWESNVRGREVENILKLAESDIGDDGDKPKAKQQEQPKLQEPFEGYDDLSAADVKEAIEALLEDDEMDDEEKADFLSETYDYEAVGKTRVGVLNALDAAHESVTGKPIAAPADVEDSPVDDSPEPEEADEVEEADEDQGYESDESSDDQSQLSSIEPWEGYNDMSVKEVTDALDAAVEEWTADEVREVFEHVFIYESANRESKRILKKIETIAEQLGAADEEDAEAAPDEARGSEAAAASEDDEPGADGAPSDEGDGESDEADDDDSADAPAEQRAEAAEQDEEGPAAEAEPDAQAGAERPADDDFGDDYRRLMESVKERIDSERLHVPAKITEEAPELPYDLTTLDNISLQQLHSAFAAFAYRVGYLRMLEEGFAKAAKQAADEMTEALIATWDAEKGETITSIKAKVDQDKNVKRLRRAQHKHEVFASSYKMQQENYNGVLDRLSRFWSMRRDEWEMSGNKIGKLPAR